MSTGYLITVGVDGSKAGRRALDWAVKEAKQHGGAVRAVAAWRWDGYADRIVTGVSPLQERGVVVEMLNRQVRAATKRYGPGVSVTAIAQQGQAVEVLTDSARTASLLVLGSHGHSPLRRGILGSVSEGCIRRARCPVVVIPAPVHERPA